MRRRRIDNPVHLWNENWVYLCESEKNDEMPKKEPKILNLETAKRVITRESAKPSDEKTRERNKMNNETIYLMSIMAARRGLNDGGAKTRNIDPLTGQIVDARPRFAGKREKGRNLSRADRHYKDSGTLEPNPGGQQRVRTTFAKPPKDSHARSNTMRRELINQAVMYTIVSLFVFMMMPLLRLVS